MHKQNITLIIILLSIGINHAVINPTSIEDVTEYYVTSLYGDSNYFKLNVINCSTSICHIICDIPNGCEELTINALSSNTLIVDSTNHLSLNYGIINADNTPNIFLQCNYTDAVGLLTGACNRLTLNARNSLNVSISVADYDLGIASLYLSNASTIAAKFYGKSCTGSSYIYIENVTNAVSIECIGFQSCHHVYIYANTMKGDLDILCVNSNACRKLLMYQVNMTGSLSITCTGATPGSCDQARIYCPMSCSIYCLGRESCGDSDIFVKDETFEEFTMECDCCDSDTEYAFRSCYWTRIQCIQSDITSTLVLDDCNNKYGCNNLECCPNTFKPENCTYSPTLSPTIPPTTINPTTLTYVPTFAPITSMPTDVVGDTNGKSSHLVLVFSFNCYVLLIIYGWL